MAANFVIETKRISDLNPAPYNPRQSTAKQEANLKASLEKFGVVEPVVYNKQTGNIVGGHFRVRELKKLGVQEVPCVVVDLSVDDEKELNIRLNANTGEWDWDMLANEWDEELLEDWGLELPMQSATEKLSEVKFEDIYYTPEHQPSIELNDCVDLTKYQAKIDAINNTSLTEQQKELYKIFAYRFIKIDFESVANYYYFNASDEEQKIIERLRLVLCDNGLNGFIEDDILRIHEQIIDWKND